MPSPAILTPTERRALILEARAECWRRGDLRYKLHAGQAELYGIIRSSKFSRFVLEIARRWGKTWLLVTIAIETCLKRKRARVVYCAPTVKDLEEFIIPTIEAICEDAPPDCRPTFNSSTGHLEFPNGSHIHLFGCDDKRKANRGRGPGAHLVIVDEAGFIPILRYVLRSVLRPQTLHTGGMTLIASTPAEEPDHDFTEIAAKAESNGAYARQTIHDNPLLSDSQIRKFIEDDARDEGMAVEEYEESDEFRREYLAERVVNKLLVVIPEWEAKRATLIRAVERPEFFDGTTILDFGGADPHAALFGYWHDPLQKWVLEDELLLKNGENTAELAQAVAAKEAALWGLNKQDGTFQGAKELLQHLPDWLLEQVEAEAQRQPFARWCDNNIHLARDLYDLHRMAFIPTAKDDKKLQVNNLRVMIRSDEVLVHPRCVHTDRHFRATTWKDHKRKEYARRGGEHGDLLDCAVYGGRNLLRRDPTPPERRQRSRRQPAALTVSQALAEVFYGHDG